MSTLLLRLAAPLQAWGINSKFDIRKQNENRPKAEWLGCWLLHWDGAEMNRWMI